MEQSHRDAAGVFLGGRRASGSDALWVSLPELRDDTVTTDGRVPLSVVRAAVVAAVFLVSAAGVWVGGALLGVGLPAGALGASTVASASPTPRGGAPVPPAPPRTVRVLLVGDSMGMTLGSGLAVDSEKWGVDFVDGATLGCDLDPTSIVDIEGSISQTAQGCLDWQNQWAAQIGALRPDVVAIAVGRWEVSDRLLNGKWTHIGEPAWNRRLEALLNEAIGVSSSRGAKVALFTLPYVRQTTEQPNGQPWDINLPGRTDEFNALLRHVAFLQRRTTTVIDVNRMLDPNGRYTSYVHGVMVRNADQEHPSVYAGMFLRPVVLPQLVRWSESARPTNS